MKKVVFVVSSDHYSNEVLTRCLEKYADATCYHFFSSAEMLIYLDLNPTLIIVGGEEFDLSKQEIERIREKLEILPVIYSVFDESISLHRVKSNGLKSVQELRYDNLLSSLCSLVKYGGGLRKVSPMLMY